MGFLFCGCLSLVAFYMFYCIDIKALSEGKICSPSFENFSENV